jgi:enoyl-CoA hydratase/carnithine racemase
MEFRDIIYTKEEGIATITLNRPQTMNAFTPTMLDEWVAAIEDAKKDDTVKVLVITGAGRGFCSGMDVKDAAGRGPEGQPLTLAERRDFLRRSVHRVPRALVDFDKPYIGAINGAAVGAGMDMASMCDIRLASDRARFGMTYVRMGIVPGDGGCYFLPRVVGIAKAAELIWTGRIFDAEEALRIGYVSKVVPHDELVVATKELARQFAKGPAVAIQLAKRLLYRCLDLDLNRALEAAESAMLVVQSTEDAREGPRAWVEKREPIFRGR